MRKRPSYNTILLSMFILGILTGWLQITPVTATAEAISKIVINLLKLVSLPMIFLSVVSTISGMKGFSEVRTMGKKVLVYAVGTTFVAALIGLGLFKLINPVRSISIPEGSGEVPSGSYVDILLNIFPSNAFQAFIDNHVIGVMLMALVLGLASLTLPKDQKQTISGFFAAFFAALLRITRWLVYLMPVGVWAFVTIFIGQLIHEDPTLLKNFFLYLVCILAANLFQGIVVLPLFAKWKGLKPLKMAKGAASALTLAFFTRSSTATLPVTLECAQDKMGISKKVSNFSIPLCSTINMNACASFIIVTVLYVATSAGVTFSAFEYILWAAIATLAAVGNAGVAMGCYFLSSALLAAMNVPLALLGMILPVYAFLDMVETSLNVWSDLCITAVVDRELEPEMIEECPG